MTFYPEPAQLPDHKQGSARAYALPPAADLAERLRSGEDVDKVAAEHHVTTTALTRRLNLSGYFVTGEVMGAKRPKAEVAGLRYDEQPWMSNAVCAQIGGDLWFSTEYEDRAIAKDICKKQCPVQTQCLAYALDVEAVADGDPVGVWGGLSANERKRIRNGDAA
jgi:WhiB family transcriptional regulator, redox-sensing transcriptional regulator